MQPQLVQPGFAGASVRARVGKPRWSAVALRALIVIGVWVAGFAALSYNARSLIDRMQGLYGTENPATSFRWTGSRVHIPLDPHSGPTLVSLTLGTVLWPGRTNQPVQLSTEAGPLLATTLTAQPRRYQFLLPPDAHELQLVAPVARPSGGEWRWLGVQVFQVSTTPSGLPLRTIGLTLLLALASLPVLMLLWWLVRHGYGPLLGPTMLGLALRMLWLTAAPPGLHRDEAVSLVDAWNLVQTGHDHMGHLLPLAAFEAYGDWTSPLLTYLQVPLVALAGPSPLVARLVTAIVGALAVPVVYVLARSLRLPVAAAGCAGLVCALSPWQIYLSRVAIPPALVPTCWGLCVLTAVLFVRDGRRRDGLALALAAGLALYAYPTMKLAVPLLLVIAIVLALLRHGWRASAAWRLPALLLALLWLPFALSTLLNPASGARFQEIGLTADSPAAWLAKWWHEYQVYLLPDFYYISGDARKVIRGVAGHGAALSVEAPLLMLGLAALALLIVARWRQIEPVPDAADAVPTPARLSALPTPVWWLILAALLIAPLPASLTEHNPNTFRAATITPLYALLVGIGAAVLWQCAARLPARWPQIARVAGTGLLVAVLAWQSAAWYTDLVQRHAALASGPFFFADGELETMQRTVELAPGYDEIWIDTATLGRPYIYLLAAQPMPPAVAQAQILVDRLPLPPNEVSQIGRYHFADLRRLPANLPARDLVLDRFAQSGYIIQQWQHDGRRLLLVRSISSLPPDNTVSDQEDVGGP